MSKTFEHDGCVGCKYERESETSDYCKGCKQNAVDKYVRMTNFDRIKDMGVEEMAETRIDRIDIYCKSDTQMWIGDFDGISESKEEALRLEMEWLEMEVEE